MTDRLNLSALPAPLKMHLSFKNVWIFCSLKITSTNNYALMSLSDVSSRFMSIYIRD